ncbi:site-specific integrase [Alistipes shahii]|uniref:Tyr recombinase domain-containing protein n=1 Tax=Alistipes shahii WAL 8301 TaxID=717959 RepID=D4IKM4_9BACT|nr:site-specific integrase [Alistipes shahii]UWN69322.1 site-specific integrase [Alistipes shahii WAL 8301]CBK63486.1 hypothetical protein AL1_09450 [Alistipes shahii WAL 8301]
MRSTFKVLFYLKRNKEQPLAPVMGRITVNGTITQFSAKIEVPVRLWEVKGGRAKGKSVEADRINRYLDNIRGQINKHYQDICDHDSYVTAERVRNAYQGFDRKYQTLLEAFEKFTVDYRKRVGVDRARRTWERYCKCSEHLHSFMEKVYRVKDMPLLELEQSFIEKFHTYLFHDLGMSPNGLSGYLKCLKYVVKMAFNNGWMPRNPFALYRYTPPQVERGYLTNEELQRLMTTPLRHKCQARTRDLFLFSCFTGICHADMRSLEWKQFEQDAAGNWWVSGNRMKTGTKYLVRLLPVPLSILNKYKGLAGPEKVFPMSTVKVMDRSLKFIAAACGIEKQLSFHLAKHRKFYKCQIIN